MFIAVDGLLAGIVAVADPIKDSTVLTIEALHALGLRVIMATGENDRTAKAVAARLGIDECAPECCRRTRRRGLMPCAHGSIIEITGDRVNDALALTAAHLGIAMGTGPDVAMGGRRIKLLGSDPMGMVRPRKLAKAMLHDIKLNLLFASAYNDAGIPIAAGVLYRVSGTFLPPTIAEAAMGLSSVSVITIALHLRRSEL